ncbi:hypothetical protein MRAB57_213 [Mycobacterium rhizamassiliense]|uniref:Protein-glutamine gamma-glutamyltransferase-like C-terminal domain-containing protein n=1 Tax=Mycobacterium rhizamassiliense TaxID=1841860 RepID=A0A2U3NLV6_9MYCO|nr:DUF4129 domain-containing protein [Mycobacterium rhizamassiliense]SPM32415.1 hypothetical protein MRAB57_213 [Mycobacterium rhizamassiliense]
MPGVDKPTRRVVALIVLLIVVAAALRGYLPARDRMTHAEPGGGRAATMFVIVLLSATLTLLGVAVIARLRDPRVAAPTTRDLSDMLGTGRGRPSWRVLFIGLGVIVAWLIIAMLLSRLWLPHDAPPPGAPPDVGAQAPPHGGQPPQPRRPRNENGDMFGVLLAAVIPMMLLLVVGTILSKRRSRGPAPASLAEGDTESDVPPRRSESLARAAELGLAEMVDLSREPREAIIACYATMERELANVPGAVPQEFDTPTEVLARAVEHRALQADNAVELVNLFEEARFSPHVMSEGHRETAVNVLELVLNELRSPV